MLLIHKGDDSLPGRERRLAVLLWLTLAGLTFALFVWRQRRAPHPLLHLALFKVMRFRLVLAAQSLAFISHGVAFVALIVSLSRLPWLAGVHRPLPGRYNESIHPIEEQT